MRFHYVCHDRVGVRHCILPLQTQIYPPSRRKKPKIILKKEEKAKKKAKIKWGEKNNKNKTFPCKA